jgi:hypothetical protein
MAALNGTYICKELGAELKVTESNDDNGEGKGTFSLGPLSTGVSIHYHKNCDTPQDNDNPGITLEFCNSRRGIRFRR